MAVDTDKVAMARPADAGSRLRRAMAMLTGNSPRPTPCRARPSTRTTNEVATAERTQPTRTTQSVVTMTVTLAGPVSQASHHRRGQGPGQQCGGEHPLGGAEGDAVGLGDGRDQGRPEAADDGHQQTHEDEGGEEEGGAPFVSHQLMTS